ncbi:MAG: hypothetical protein HQ528_02890 [Candidatus Marinimicrobia bacterium]|nr:hypothetical protein [Candidatus Neomarinimicrobiota bacterium]
MVNITPKNTFLDVMGSIIHQVHFSEEMVNITPKNTFLDVMGSIIHRVHFSEEMVNMLILMVDVF